jgi:hypothetical protein
MDAKWFRDRMQDRELNQTKVATLIGWADRSTMSKVMAGSRQLHPQEAADMARILGVPLADVLRHAGVTVPKETTAQVPLVGTADERGIVAPGVEGSKRIERPLAGATELVAVRIRAARTPFNGWAAFFVPSSRLEPDAVGRLAVVQPRNAKGKARYLGVLERGADRDQWQVTPLSGPIAVKPHTIDKTAVEWAAPVLWIMT